MRTFAGIEELAEAKGEHLGHTDWVTVNQQHIDMFAEATGDHQWIHLDREKAAEGPFGTTIAHGYLSLSMLAFFSPQLLKVTQRPRMTVNYGLNKVRFLQPVKVDSRIRDSGVLSDVRTTDRGVLLTVTHTVEIEGEERPALVAETLGLWVP